MSRPRKRSSTVPKENTENVPVSAINYSTLDTPLWTKFPLSAKLIVALITFCGAMGSYLTTFARNVTLVDSGELILASAKLGVAHPPGTPLYTLLGYLFAKLPWGSVAARLSFMSSLFAALTATLIALSTIELKQILTQLASDNVKNKENFKKEEAWDWVGIYIIPIAVGWVGAFSVTIWYYASVAEVYTLNISLVALILYLMLIWYKTGQNWLIPTAAAIYGLALGVHHVTVLLTLPAIAVFVWRIAGLKIFFTRPVALAFLAVFFGVSIYWYLPLAASQSPILNWGNPVNWQKFYWHISAKQYQVNLFSANSELLSREFNYFSKLALRQFTIPGLIVALMGIVVLWQRQKALFLLLINLIFFDLAYSFCYEIAEDKDAYYLTTNLALLLAMAIGFNWLYEKACNYNHRLALVVVVIIALLPILNFIFHYTESNRRNYLIARDFVENTMRGVASGGLLLTLDWQFYSPYLYMHHIENFRPDAIVIDINLLRRSWYIEGYLTEQYPEMMQACKVEKDTFLAQLILFEQDRPYDVNLINKGFIELINAFIKFNIEKNSAYLTFPTEKGIATDYNWVPQGLTMRLYKDKEFHPFWPQIELRGLIDSSVHLDEVAKGKVLRTYATMYANHGRYLAAGKDYKQALEFLQMAPQFANDLDWVYELIGDVYAVQGQMVEAEEAYRKGLMINTGNPSIQKKLNSINKSH